MKTTLNQIRKYSPCRGGWEKLLSHLGKTKADDEPICISTILDSNGLDDALWCLQAVKCRDREIRLFGVWCVRQMQHLIADQRSLDALDVAERFANGEATYSELAAARAAAWAAEAAAGDAAEAAQSQRLRELCAECASRNQITSEDDMSDLNAAKVGSAIRLPEKYTSGFRIVTVTKLTASQVHCGDTRLRKSDGLIIGCDHHRQARIADDNDVLAYRIKVVQSRVASIKVTAENLSLVESLIVTHK